MDVTETDMKESEDKEEEDGAVGEEETQLSPAAALSLPHVCGEGLATRIHRVIVRNIISGRDRHDAGTNPSET